MEFLIALLVVVIAWWLFKSLFAVIMVLIACALVIWIMRHGSSV